MENGDGDGRGEARDWISPAPLCRKRKKKTTGKGRLGWIESGRLVCLFGYIS